MARFGLRIGSAGPFLLAETGNRYNFVQGALVKETAQPAVPADWSNPRRATVSIAGLSAFAGSPLAILSPAVAASPIVAALWPNPRGPVFPIDNRGWLAAMSALLYPGPIVPRDWPNPRGAVFPIDNRAWTRATPATLLLGVLPPGGPPPDFTSLRGKAPSIAGLSWQAGTPLAILSPAVAASPIAPLDWPNPRGAAFPLDARSWARAPPLPLLLGVLPPGASPHWPNPRGAAFPAANRGWLAAMSALLYPAPTKPPLSYDWQNPRGPRAAIELRTLAGRVPLVLFPSPVKPPVSFDWTNAIRRTAFYPVALRGFLNAVPIFTQPAIVKIIGYPPAPLGYPNPIAPGQFASGSWVRRVAEVTNLVQAGRINATVGLELLPNTTSTSIIDSRIGPASFLTFMPLTPAAAVELAAGTMFVGSQTKGSATVTHSFANNDRRFRVLIIG